MLTERPTRPEIPARQQRLRGHLAERQIGGRTFEHVYRQVTDAEPVETCIAVAKSRRERRVRDFMTVAAQTLGDDPARLAAVD